jgi:hypothetical protein
MSGLLSDPRVQQQPALVDTRVIEFGRKTIMAALETVGVKLLNLPADKAISLLELDPTTNAFKAIYVDGAVHTVDESRLAAVMIAYCIAARLPISRWASKAVKMTEHGITLKFTTTLATPPRV